MSDFINTIDLLGDDVVFESIVNRTITEFKDDRVSSLKEHAFHNCTELRSVSLPMFDGKIGNTDTGTGAFQGCTNLVDIDLPNLTIIPSSFLDGALGLTKVYFPKAKSVAIYSFSNSTNLRIADFGRLETIERRTFYGCEKLVAFVSRSEQVPTLGSTEAFMNTPIADGTGYIYVPRSLLDLYKSNTGWSDYSEQYRALEDYTIDGTLNTELATGCTAISLDVTELTFTEAGTKTLTPTLTPLRTIDNNIIWRSDNLSVATVVNGVVTARRNGTAKITATCVDGYAECTVTVSGIEGVVTNTLYSLPATTTFNGTSDYIDTGIPLFDTPKNFTIICSATFGNLANNMCLFHCMKESSPWPGLSLDGNSGARICYTASGTANVSITSPSTIRSLGIRYESGMLSGIMYATTSGEVKTVSISGTPTYTSIPQNLILGAYQTTTGTKGRYFSGTINIFDVYDMPLSDDELTDMLLSI